MLDDFSTAVVNAVLDDLPCKDHTLRKVKALAWQLYIDWRDLLIEAQAESTLESVPDWKLRELVPTVIDLLAGWREVWECPSDDAASETAAWGLACLRWLNREARGLAPPLALDDEGVQALIDLRRLPEQLPLW